MDNVKCDMHSLHCEFVSTGAPLFFQDFAVLLLCTILVAASSVGELVPKCC